MHIRLSHQGLSSLVPMMPCGHDSGLGGPTLRVPLLTSPLNGGLAWRNNPLPKDRLVQRQEPVSHMTTMYSPFPRSFDMDHKKPAKQMVDLLVRGGVMPATVLRSAYQSPSDDSPTPLLIQSRSYGPPVTRPLFGILTNPL